MPNPFSQIFKSKTNLKGQMTAKDVKDLRQKTTSYFNILSTTLEGCGFNVEIDRTAENGGTFKISNDKCSREFHLVTTAQPQGLEKPDPGLFVSATSKDPRWWVMDKIEEDYIAPFQLEEPPDSPVSASLTALIIGKYFMARELRRMSPG